MANNVKLVGFVHNIKKITDNKATCGLSIGVKQQDGSYKNGWVNCVFNPSKLELVEGDQYSMEGFFTFNFWTPEGADKERAELRLVVQKATPGNEGTNFVELTGFVNNLKKITDNMARFGLNVGVKQQDDTYKNGWVNCKYNPTRLEIVAGERYTIQGFVTFDFWTPEGSDKERSTLQIWVQDALPETTGAA